jgi:alcohol dehydrogenase (cytochrome c)
MVNWCGTAHRDAQAPVYETGEHYRGGMIDQDPMGEARGVLAAVDVTSGRLRWKIETDAPMLANVTSTAGGVIFAGDLKGTLYAVNADSGTVLLRHSLKTAAGGGMFTYAVNGKQYVSAVFGPVSAFFPSGTGTTRLVLLNLP